MFGGGNEDVDRETDGVDEAACDYECMTGSGRSPSTRRPSVRMHMQRRNRVTIVASLTGLSDSGRCGHALGLRTNGRTRTVRRSVVT